MRAMSSLLDAAPPSQHAADTAPSSHSQHAFPTVPAATAATAGLPARDAGTVSPRAGVGAKDSATDATMTPLSDCEGVGANQASNPQSLEQAFALGMLHRKGHASAAGPQPQQLLALSEADRPAGTGASDEPDEAGVDHEAVASARRQQLVDDAVDKLFEEMTHEACSSPAGRSSGTTCFSEMEVREVMDSKDSGLLSAVSADGSRESSSSSAASGMGSDEEEEHKDMQEVMAVLGLQSYTGLQRVLQQALQPLEPTSAAASSSTADADITSSSLGASRQGLTVSGVRPNTTLGDAMVGITPRQTTPQAAETAATAGATTAATAAPRAQTARPNQQSAMGLPGLALSRGNRRSVNPATEEQPVLVPNQQTALQARDIENRFSQAEMQSMVDFVFRAGFERMGQIAEQSAADPVPLPADVDVDTATLPASTSVTVQDAGVQEMSHAEMQHAFNKLVVHGLQRDGHCSSQQSQGIVQQPQAIAKAATAPTRTAPALIAAAPELTTATAAATAVGPASTGAVAPASSIRHSPDMDKVPKQLVGMERARIAQTVVENELPRFHSVFSRYDRDRHVREITELTNCHRQVGFAAPGAKQQPSWLKPACKVLLGIPSLMLARGLARGMSHRQQYPTHDVQHEHELSHFYDSSDSSEYGD
ncbi:hypothetical protein ABBQ32_000078 [Trebouxia sp. C0010 RCD-2024]